MESGKEPAKKASEPPKPKVSFSSLFDSTIAKPQQNKLVNSIFADSPDLAQAKLSAGKINGPPYVFFSLPNQLPLPSLFTNNTGLQPAKPAPIAPNPPSLFGPANYLPGDLIKFNTPRDLPFGGPLISFLGPSSIFSPIFKPASPVSEDQRKYIPSPAMQQPKPEPVNRSLWVNLFTSPARQVQIEDGQILRNSEIDIFEDVKERYLQIRIGDKVIHHSQIAHTHSKIDWLPRSRQTGVVVMTFTGSHIEPKGGIIRIKFFESKTCLAFCKEFAIAIQ